MNITADFDLDKELWGFDVVLRSNMSWIYFRVWDITS